VGVEATAEELYWPCLFVARCFVLLGTLFLRDRAALWLQLTGTCVVFFVMSRWMQ